MSKNHLKQRPTEIKGAKAGAARTPLTEDEREQVYKQIRERHSKAALQMAKDIHKRSESEESEALLTDAYRARIEDLLKLRMTVEAKALLAIVRERMPRAFSRLSGLDQEIQMLECRFEQIVARLSDPALKPEERARIEEFIRQRADDLTALSEMAALPADHSLRVAARALAEAFEAVTRGPIEPELLALSEVSRRSPLASWKGLIRAIDSYYRGEKKECRQWLATIAADSVPARLLPAMNALCGKGAGELTATAKRLIAAVGDRGTALRQAAEAFDRAVAARKHKTIMETARKVMEAAGHLSATERERLRQHIAIYCMKLDLSPENAQRALGIFKEDAYYLRMLALALEDLGSAEAVLAWDNFRDEAIRRKWFTVCSLEDGVLSLRMARLVERMPRGIVKHLTEDDGVWAPGVLGRTRKLVSSPEPLYARASQADPDAECFQAWLDWAKKKADPKAADDVAERWRQAQPGDVRPLLHLVDSAEARKALKKSLNYLEEAEKLDRLNPAVRRVRRRLLLAAALRHLEQGKPHLVHREIADLFLLPEGPQRECTILIYALDWFCAALENDEAAMAAKSAALAQALGAVGRHLLLMAINQAANKKVKICFPEFETRSLPTGELLMQTAHVCQLGELTGLPIPMRYEWNSDLVMALEQPAPGLDVAQLLAFGEAALNSIASELAYAASAAGLASGKAAARFLFLRARALPVWAAEQRRGCLAAAIALARQERDGELTDRILDWMHEPTRGPFGWMSRPTGDWAARPIAEDLLGAILEEERKRKELPSRGKYRRPRYEQQLDDHEARGPGGFQGFDEYSVDWDDEDDWDDASEDAAPGGDFDGFIDHIEKLFKHLPPDTLERIDATAAKGGDAFGEIDRIVEETKEKPGRTRNNSLPEQASLFGEEE